jgi:hypothetical protein
LLLPRYLFSVFGPHLYVYSITSGEIVYRLVHNKHYQQNQSTQTDNNKQKDNANYDEDKESDKNESNIQAMCLNPNNKYQLITFHQDYIVCMWDYEDGILLKVKKIFSNLIFNN